MWKINVFQKRIVWSCVGCFQSAGGDIQMMAEDATNGLAELFVDDLVPLSIYEL